MFLLGFLSILLVSNVYMVYLAIQIRQLLAENSEFYKQENEAIKQKLSLAIRPPKEEKWTNMREAFSVKPPEKNG